MVILLSERFRIDQYDISRLEPCGGEIGGSEIARGWAVGGAGELGWPRGGL